MDRSHKTEVSPRHRYPSSHLPPGAARGEQEKAFGRKAQAMEGLKTWLSNPDSKEPQAIITECNQLLAERLPPEDHTKVRECIGVAVYLQGHKSNISNRLNYVNAYLLPAGKKEEAKKILKEILTEIPTEEAKATPKLLTLATLCYRKHFFDPQALPQRVRNCYMALVKSEGKDKVAIKTLMRELELAMTATPRYGKLPSPDLLVIADMFQNKGSVVSVFDWTSFDPDLCKSAYEHFCYLKVHQLGIHPDIPFDAYQNYFSVLASYPWLISHQDYLKERQQLLKLLPANGDMKFILRAGQDITHYTQWIKGLSQTDQQELKTVKACFRTPETFSHLDAAVHFRDFLAKYEESMPLGLKDRILEAYFSRCSLMMNTPNCIAPEQIQLATNVIQEWARTLPAKTEYLPLKTRVLLSNNAYAGLKDLLSHFPIDQHPQIAGKLRTLHGIVSLAEGKTQDAWVQFSMVLGAKTEECFQALHGQQVPAPLKLHFGNKGDSTEDDQRFCRDQLQQFAHRHKPKPKPPVTTPSKAPGAEYKVKQLPTTTISTEQRAPLSELRPPDFDPTPGSGRGKPKPIKADDSPPVTSQQRLMRQYNDANSRDSLFSVTVASQPYPERRRYFQ